ncbi:MAG: ArsR/SmtB family transcription factor [Desulfovibrionaceae bacterium]
MSPPADPAARPGGTHAHAAPHASSHAAPHASSHGAPHVASHAAATAAATVPPLAPAAPPHAAPQDISPYDDAPRAASAAHAARLDVAGPDDSDPDDAGPDDAGPDCTGREVHAAAVAQARALLPDPAELERTSALFRALGEPSRAALLLALHLGELCVCDLAEVLGASVSSVSHHLRLLRAERLVRCRRDGKNAFYRLDDDHVRTLLAQALEHVRHDEPAPRPAARP